MPRKGSQYKLLFVYFLILLALGYLVYRLLAIQVLDLPGYFARAEEYAIKEIPIAHKRGQIVDRWGDPLATSLQTYTLWARPDTFDRPEEAMTWLEENLGLERADLEKAFDRTSGIARLADGLDAKSAEMVENSPYAGLWTDRASRRVYPNGSLASLIVGHINDYGTAEAGVERFYEERLAGRDGYRTGMVDVNGNSLPFIDTQVIDPIDGSTLMLTIDSALQHSVEKTIEEAQEIHQAKSVHAIVMDPRNGEILAMASTDQYDPNDSRAVLEGADPGEVFERWLNPMVSSTYEPGSTFKIFTSAFAMEENIASPNSRYVGEGSIKVADSRIHCWVHPRSHGEQTLTEALENSCNPVFVQVGLSIGRDLFADYLEMLGFYSRTGIDLPAETGQIMYQRSQLNPVELATLSFGHGLSVTPIRLVTSTSALINGGFLVTPHVLKAVDGEEKPASDYRLRQVISADTSEKVRLMMESVVVNGSGKLAYIPGIRSGGKTGTSEKIVNGLYDSDKVVSSYIGFAPVEDPRAIVLVVVDEPQVESYGSRVAAPIAGQIMDDALQRLGIEPKMADGAEVAVPNLKGKTLEEAREILESAKLSVTTEPLETADDQMIVNKQYPREGTSLKQGSLVILYLEE
jgi:stage V sporulation protein D (sporulation-specific penicillin-binding protein)